MSEHEKIEQPICKRLVAKALEAGFAVGVYDGEGWVVNKSTNKTEIVAAMFSTDSDTLAIYENGKRIGMVDLIYGNGEDVISDCTDKPAIVELVNAAMGDR